MVVKANAKSPKRHSIAIPEYYLQSAGKADRLEMVNDAMGLTSEPVEGYFVIRVRVMVTGDGLATSTRELRFESRETLLLTMKT